MGCTWRITLSLNPVHAGVKQYERTNALDVTIPLLEHYPFRRNDVGRYCTTYENDKKTSETRNHYPKHRAETLVLQA